MSYILDALKRADAERGQPQASDTPFAIPQPERTLSGTRRKRRTVPLVLGLIVVLAAGGWWLYGGSTTDGPSSSFSEPKAASSTPTEFEPTPISKPATSVVVMASDPSTAPTAPVLPILAPTPPPPPPRPSAPAKERVAQAQASVAPPSNFIDETAQSSPTARPDAAPPTAVARVAPATPAAPVLSAADRAGLPQVKISGSSYSTNPEHRILIANGLVVKEGQEVSPGLTLEVIGPHSAVFNHRGTRYNINY